jgi:hypothetical protein
MNAIVRPVVFARRGVTSAQITGHRSGKHG